MATTVGLIKGATEVVLGIGEVSIDNFTFKLFYKWSVSLFIAGSVAVCSSQFFGDPVACETVTFLNFLPRIFWELFSPKLFDQNVQADDSVDEEVLNHYCWMYSTFDIPEDFMVSYKYKHKYEIQIHVFILHF